MKYFVSTLSIFSLLFLPTAFAENDSLRDRMEGQKEERKENKQEDRDGKKGEMMVTFTPEQITCLKNAITKREDALIAGHTTYTTTVNKAFTDRKTALLSAMDKVPAERREAIRSADRAFKDATRSARMKWNESRRGAWKTFATDRQACLPQAQIGASDTGSSKSDASL